jgi:hypothetical protein
MGLVKLLELLDFYGILPALIIKVDPMHTSAFVSNLGSIGTDAPYHHLMNGERLDFCGHRGHPQRAAVMPDGSIQARES